MMRPPKSFGGFLHKYFIAELKYVQLSMFCFPVINFCKSTPIFTQIKNPALFYENCMISACNFDLKKAY